MKKGFAYCGLACDFCTEGEDCPGCRKAGCSGKEWCQCFQCGHEKSFNGCWECPQFPCDNHMLNKLRVRAFARFIGIYGEEKLYECLKTNESHGIVYHYSGGHVGDYDQFDTEEDIINFIFNGRRITEDDELERL